MAADAQMTEMIVEALGGIRYFASLSIESRGKLASRVDVQRFAAGEEVYGEGQKADAFYFILEGDAVTRVRPAGQEGPAEVRAMGRLDTFGEVALLLRRPREEAVVARSALVVGRIDGRAFASMSKHISDFTAQVAAGMARELASSQRAHAAATHLIVEDLSSPGRPAHTGRYNLPTSGSRTSPELDKLLKRLVDGGASDLHLHAGHRPRWRVDGDLERMPDTQRLMGEDVYDLLRPVMDPRHREAFEGTNDADFAYSLSGVARFRVNILRDARGVSAVFRQIPAKIMSMQELGLPKVLERMCEHPKGLVLVTGPTGSGKSTTLAAMIDFINRHQRKHILTLEDPIEFLHRSQRALVTQREVGSHTKSFTAALRAALREDPDIVLVGEMRDLETMSLALEVANTGHLVFGTLHTATAVTTIERIIGMFPVEEQALVRVSLASVLKGVLAQTLCRKRGGGRVAALEIMVCNSAVANLIREGKTHQLASIMTTGKKFGNATLNDVLHDLVKQGIIERDEALIRAVDKGDIAKRLGVELKED